MQVLAIKLRQTPCVSCKSSFPETFIGQLLQDFIAYEALWQGQDGFSFSGGFMEIKALLSAQTEGFTLFTENKTQTGLSNRRKTVGPSSWRSRGLVDDS